jgi:hypothetical protein
MVEVGEIGTRRMLFTPNESDGASYSLSKAAEPIAAAGECGLNGFSINRLLSPELAPRAPESHLHPHSERIEIGQLRRRQRTDWGMHNKVCTTIPCRFQALTNDELGAFGRTENAKEHDPRTDSLPFARQRPMTEAVHPPYCSRPPDCTYSARENAAPVAKLAWDRV